MRQSQFAPVFKQGDNRLIILHEQFVGETKERAWRIGLGASLVECVLLGIRPSKGDDGLLEVVEIVDGQIPHFPARLGLYRVALLSGPLFDEGTKPVPATDGAAR